MSSEVVKICVPTAYTRVPSKSKLLASKLPKKEANLQIKFHSNDIKMHMFRNSDVRDFTLSQSILWPSRGEMAKQTGDGERDLSQKCTWFEDTGTLCHSEVPWFAKQRLQLQQVSPKQVCLQQKKSSPLRWAIETNAVVLKLKLKKGSAAALWRNLSPCISAHMVSKRS